MDILRIGLDVEIISCLAAASGLVIATSAADVLGQHSTAPAAQQKFDGLSLTGVYKDYKTVAVQQSLQARSLLPNTKKNLILEKIILNYYAVVAVFLPITLTYITYIAIRFHFAFLAGVIWASLCGFMLLAITAAHNLSLVQKIRMILITPVIYIPFLVITIYWAVKLATVFLRAAANFFMKVKVIPA
ncbi:MAG TPA: hypothetical protein VFT49_02105 [Candidatus Saccharimonadales bacterium]|nr:hypothetical protein [Candidatus Saccharimonadales bacterium]